MADGRVGAERAYLRIYPDGSILTSICLIMATLTSKTRKKSKIRPRKPQFWEEFAAELDIFDSTLDIPAWTFDYRDDLIRKIGPELKKICRRLKELGLDFKIKWPVEIDGKWKFADVYFPRQRAVLMVTNAMAVAGRPHWMLSDRAEFFKDRFRVVEVETLAELERKMALKAKERV